MREYDPLGVFGEKLDTVLPEDDNSLIHVLSVYELLPIEGDVNDLLRELRGSRVCYDRDGIADMLQWNETWVVGYKSGIDRISVGVLIAYSKSDILYFFSRTTDGEHVFCGLSGNIKVKWGVVSNDDV